MGLPLACAVLVWPRNGPPDLWLGDAGTQAARQVGQIGIAGLCLERGKGAVKGPQEMVARIAEHRIFPHPPRRQRQ